MRFILFFFLIFSSSLCYSDEYYAVFFAANHSRPRLTHVFAGFYQTENKIVTDECVISWMPETLDVVILKSKPESAVNLDIKTSIELIDETGATLGIQGPYIIRKELFDLAKIRLQSLQKMQYKAVDGKYRPNRASNCIHAISDILIRDKPLDTKTALGDNAIKLIVEHFGDFIIQKSNEKWLSKQLNLPED